MTPGRLSEKVVSERSEWVREMLRGFGRCRSVRSMNSRAIAATSTQPNPASAGPSKRA